MGQPSSDRYKAPARPPETEDRGLQAAHPDVPQVLRSSMNGPALSDPLGRALPSDFNRRGLFPSSVSRVP